jgi:hypothetical protein
VHLITRNADKPYAAQRPVTNLLQQITLFHGKENGKRIVRKFPLSVSKPIGAISPAREDGERTNSEQR